MRSGPQQLTRDEFQVLDSLIKAYAVSARKIAAYTKPMGEAARAGNRAAFQEIYRECLLARSECEALRMAIRRTKELFRGES